MDFIESTDWPVVMDREIRELGRLIGYLRERNVTTTVVLLPRVGWTDDLPYPAQYEEGVKALCDSESVELVDLSHLIPDDLFVDSSHVNLAGLRKQHSALAAIANRHL